MRLSIVDHLQLVFDIAQEKVGAVERFELRLGNQLLLSKRLESTNSVAAENVRRIRAVADLQGLNNEFDLSNPPRTELDVSPCLSAIKHLTVHPGFHIPNICERL